MKEETKLFGITTLYHPHNPLQKLNTLLHHYFYMGMPQVEFIFDEDIFINADTYNPSSITYNPLFCVIDVPYKNKLMFHYDYKHSPLLSLFQVIKKLEHDFHYVKWGHNSITHKWQYKLSTNKIPLRWFLLLKECMLPPNSCRVRVQKYMNYSNEIDLIPLRKWIYEIEEIKYYQTQFPSKLYIHSKDWLVHSFRMSKFTETVFYKIQTLMVNNNQTYFQMGSYTEQYYSGFAVRNHQINQWRRILDVIDPERRTLEIQGEHSYMSSIDISKEELAIIYGIFKYCGVDCVLDINPSLR